MRLIDENEYQEKLARVPMELRTYRKAVEVASDMPTVKAIPLDRMEQIKTEISNLSPTPTAEDVVDGNAVKDAIWEVLVEVNEIIDKALGEVCE